MKNKIFKIGTFSFCFFIFISFGFAEETKYKYNIIKEIDTMDKIHSDFLTISDNLDIKKNETEENQQNGAVFNDKAFLTDNIELESGTENQEEKTILTGNNLEKKDSTVNKEEENKILADNKNEKKEENSVGVKNVKEIEGAFNNDKNLKQKNEATFIRDEKKEDIRDRSNRVAALGSAMGAIDLGSTPAKKIRFGAGVGNSSSSQAVAVGVGYAPTENFRFNTKFSSSTDAITNNSISVGASYDLDIW